MRTDFLPFSRPSIDEDDINAVAEVLRSGWITTGPYNQQLEQAVCAYTGARGAVALASATAGMHLLLHALGIGPGDEVITPSMTWVSTVNLICLVGATPVFVDVERDTLMLTAERVAEKITPRTKLIIPVHFAGAALDLEPLRTLAAQHGIPLAEDAAHAIGTRYQGKPVGHSGTAIFSFHPIKNITTGEGGMFCSDDEALLDKIRQLKFHGLGVDAFDRQQQGRSPQAEVLQPGFKYNLTDMAAVLGVRQLARLDEFNRRRAELATLYREKLAAYSDLLEPLKVPDYAQAHAWHLFIVRLHEERAGLSRDAFMAALKQHNIGSGLHFRAVHTQKYYRERFPHTAGNLPNTEWNSSRILSLPLFPAMRDEDVDDVIAAIEAILLS